MTQYDRILAGLAALDRRADTVAHRLDDISTHLDRMEHALDDMRATSQAIRQDVTAALDGQPWTQHRRPWHAA